MSERLTEARLAEIRDRLARATPGEWHVQHDADDNDPSWVSATFKGLATVTSTVAQRPQGMLGEDWQHDARLIAHAPADLRDLLDALAERDHLLAVLAQDSEAERDGFRRGLAAAREIVLDEIEKYQPGHTSALVAFGLAESLDRIDAAAREAGDAVPLALDEVRQDNERLREALRRAMREARGDDGLPAVVDICEAALGEDDG